MQSDARRTRPCGSFDLYATAKCVGADESAGALVCFEREPVEAEARRPRERLGRLYGPSISLLLGDLSPLTRI